MKRYNQNDIVTTNISLEESWICKGQFNSLSQIGKNRNRKGWLNYPISWGETQELMLENVPYPVRWVVAGNYQIIFPLRVHLL